MLYLHRESSQSPICPIQFLYLHLHRFILLFVRENFGERKENSLLLRFFSSLFCSLGLILCLRSQILHCVQNDTMRLLRKTSDSQLQGRFFCVAIHCNAFIKSSRFIGFINHFHFQRATRTDRFFTIFCLGTSTGGNDILYRQDVVTRVGQGKAMFLFFLHRELAKIHHCLTDRNLSLCSR